MTAVANMSNTKNCRFREVQVHSLMSGAGLNRPYASLHRPSANRRLWSTGQLIQIRFDIATTAKIRNTTTRIQTRSMITSL